MKLSLFDKPEEIFIKMSEGNPGCLTFLMEVAKKKDGNLFIEICMRLDVAGLYGSHAYMLWNDCCGRDTEKTIRMIKSLEKDELRSYVVDKGRGEIYEEEK